MSEWPWFKIMPHMGWIDVKILGGFITAVWRRGWRKSYAYWSPDATPIHERAVWVWGRKNFWRYE